MKELLRKALKSSENLNEQYIEVGRDSFKDACVYLSKEKRAPLRLMFATDERRIDGNFRVYAVFSGAGVDKLITVTTAIKEDDPKFRSITSEIPAAHWYEREIADMFGIVPDGHPAPGRLVFHPSFPVKSHPLRKDWGITESELKAWGEGFIENQPDSFMRVEGEGVFEIPVGPVHAGIIEPGHFRFSAVGETIFYLDPKLFYTHKGTEKHFERIGFHEGVKLAERVSGTSSFSHSSAYCMAVERAAGAEISEKAKANRTVLIELERLYNHIGDIGNLCAGTALSVGYAKGAVIKETLMQLNHRLTGSRYLRGINTLGGITKDALNNADDILGTIDEVKKQYKQLMKLLENVSHVERLEGAGVLSKEIARRLGVTGVAARASGINDDMRKAHPHLLYDSLDFEVYTMERGDVYARMMVRAQEAECSVSIINTLLEKRYDGELTSDIKEIPPLSRAFGYAETPRGSVFYFVMSDEKGNPLRVKLRSPSYCNWPVVPFAVHGNIVPDFPLCNKSFNLSYSGCDM